MGEYVHQKGMKYSSSSIDAEKKNVNQAPRATFLLVMILGGTIAVSGFIIWTEIKATVAMPVTPNSMTIRQSSHRYTAPPHCRASRSETVAGTKNNMPTGSSLWICPKNVTGR